MILYHLMRPEAWQGWRESQGDYRPASLESEGFIHCCTAEQICWVANRHYAHWPALRAVELDATRLNSPWKLEPPPEDPASDWRFPHLYGPLEIQAVRSVFDLIKHEGRFELPLERGV